MVNDNTTQSASSNILSDEHDTSKDERRDEPANHEQSFISVFIRLVNETVLKVNVNPSATIQYIKRTYFSKELSNNKIVRFIYQGQFLKDSQTLESYNIRDQTTIHCHITTGQQPQTEITAPQTTTSTTNILDDEHPLRSSNQELENQNSNPTESQVSSNNQNTSTNASNTSSRSSNPDTIANTITRNTLANIEYGTILLPLLTILLASAWFFRINFKQFFSPLYNIFLVILSFIYVAFLIIHFYRIFNYVNRHPTTTARTVTSSVSPVATE